MEHVVLIYKRTGADRVMVSYPGEDECSHDCRGCHACEGVEEKFFEVEDPLNLQPGDYAVISSPSSRILTSASMLLFIPLILLLLTFSVCQALHLSDPWMTILCAAAYLGSMAVTALFVRSFSKNAGFKIVRKTER